MVIDKIEVRAEYLTTFTSFDQWVNKAASRIGGYGRHQNIVCIDASGSTCFIGADFMHARDNNLFPVKAYRLIRAVEN